ncbi:iron ABC transporter permease [Neorhizobium lilium]|uniref:Iron ABC transporter permease n=1 Tax=Neorhizobium lilium TaxID=2503024 RepID=A0A444LKV6_9HYPH|nr:iron ABC transporter permease [Neorhizobium lilium]RWX80942.1 iron ABC transporter permease [Neorhizobium lilium]
MRGRLLLPVMLVTAILLSLMVGQVFVTPADLWTGLWKGTGSGALTLRVLRGPAAFTAAGAGAVLGASGTVFQVLLRNPLAAPDVMGFMSGAGLAVVTAVAFGILLPLPLLAAAGGLLAAVVVALLSFRGAGVQSSLTLILVGIGVGFFAVAASSFLITRMPPQEAADAQRWLSGSLAARSWWHVLQVWGLGSLLFLVLALQVRTMALLELGDELAAGLGARVGRARYGLIGTGVLLAATGVAVAGPIPFVAMMAGPLGMRVAGVTQPGSRLAVAAVTGAIVTILADVVARSVVPGLQLPVGVMTGILGAPYLLWLLMKEAEAGEL